MFPNTKNAHCMKVQYHVRRHITSAGVVSFSGYVAEKSVSSQRSTGHCSSEGHTNDRQLKP